MTTDTSTTTQTRSTEQQDHETWIQLFASRLTACWPRLEAADAEHVGDGLSREARWRNIDPSQAAERWMALVMSATPKAPTTKASRSLHEVAS